MKKSFFLILLLFIQLIIIDHLDGAKPIHIICSTSDFSSIVHELLEDEAHIDLIIPFAMCPGHFDLSPKEVKSFQQADLIFYHGYERFILDLIKDNQNFVQVKVIGNWMIPQVHLKGAELIAQILAEKFPQHQEKITENLKKYIKKVELEEKKMKQELVSLQGTTALSAVMNKEFIEWLGPKVLKDFPRDENISPRNLKDIILLARKNNVKFVFDNLQSSGKMGRTIAHELGIPFILISNFPQNNDYPATLAQISQKIRKKIP